MNSAELSKIAKASPTAELAFLALAMRERLRGSHMNITKFKYNLISEGCEVDTAALYAMFETLEETKHGKIVKRVGGRPIEFMWNDDVRVVGRAGLAINERQLGEMKKGELLSGARNKPKKPTRLTLLYVVDDNEMTLDIPVSFTVADIDRMARFIKSSLFKGSTIP